jgi:tRNA(fMet)-specific endonuclease VapC
VKYLLDTNICIYLIKQKPASVIRQFNKLSPGDICISVITLYELMYGAYKSQQVERNITAINRFTAPLEIMQFDVHDADTCAKLRAVLEKQGQVIGPLDLQIAAQAITRNCILVTNNQKEFKRVKGLKMENWVE